MDSIMGGVPQTKRRKVNLKKMIKIKHAHNSTIYNNPLIYIILLERSKKLFTILIASTHLFASTQYRQLELNHSVRPLFKCTVINNTK